MPSALSAANTHHIKASMSQARPHSPAEPPTSSAQKGATTARRRKEERRADTLRQMSAQIDDGTLVVRQMSATEHATASQDARRRRMQTQAGRRQARAAGKGNQWPAS
jgi:hypothetical protein